MARTTQLQKIINLALDKGAKENDILLLSRLYEISPIGVINDFSDHHKKIVDNIFSGNNYAYLQSAKFLTEINFIEFCSYDADRLLIPVCDRNRLFEIEKRTPNKYWRNPFEKIDSFLSSLTRYRKNFLMPAINEAKRDLTIKKEMINWDKILGISVPRKYSDLLIGFDERFRYSREKVKYILGLISQLDGEDEIKDFTITYITAQLQDLFEKDKNGKDTINEHTIKDVHSKLLKEGIISQRIENGKTIVKLNGYSESFETGYVVIPYCIFRGAFKRMRTAAYKIFFYVIFKWNNGEHRTQEGKFEIDPDKPVIFKLLLTSNDNSETKDKYYRNLVLWLKKRCSTELKALFWGEAKEGTEPDTEDEGNNDFMGLDQIFSIDFTKFKTDGTILLRLRHEYRVLKRDVKNLKRSFNYLNRYQRKAKVIKKILEKNNLEHTQQDWKDFVQIFRYERARVIEKLVKLLIIELENRVKRRDKPIKSLGAYINTMYKNYKTAAI